MLTTEKRKIITVSREKGWVLEPDAKRLFASAGLDVPHFKVVTRLDEAIHHAHAIGYPVVAKIVSPRVIHKTEKNGVILGIDSDEKVAEAFQHLHQIEGFAGMLIEETVSGVELIVGAKIDDQFGPIILMGIGGTAVEIYQDVVLRMAPLREEDVGLMVKCLKAHQLLEGYRGAEPVNMKELTRLFLTFSNLVMDLEPEIESIDLNPVICAQKRCVVADARIILKK